MSEVKKYEGTVIQKFQNATPFMIDAIQSVANLQKYCEYLSTVPDAIPKYYISKPAAIFMAIQMGLEINLTPVQSLQFIYPVNGKLAIMGDGCLYMIRRSGILGKFVEEETGSIEKEDYKITLTATRADTGETKSRSFSIDDAKRLGKWITPSEAAKDWKKKVEPWFKNPTRMCYYRALGFLSRDLFSDVINGAAIKEIEEDYQQETIDTVPISEETVIKVSSENSKRADDLNAQINKKIKAPKITEGRVKVEPTKNVDKTPKVEESKENVLKFEKETATDVDSNERTEILIMLIEEKTEITTETLDSFDSNNDDDKEQLLIIVNAYNEENMEPVKLKNLPPMLDNGEFLKNWIISHQGGKEKFASFLVSYYSGTQFEEHKAVAAAKRIIGVEDVEGNNNEPDNSEDTDPLVEFSKLTGGMRLSKINKYFANTLGEDYWDKDKAQMFSFLKTATLEELKAFQAKVLKRK